MTVTKALFLFMSRLMKWVLTQDFINSYINKKFTTPLRSTIAELTGLDCTKIVYTVEQNVCKRSGFFFEY